MMNRLREEVLTETLRYCAFIGSVIVVAIILSRIF